MKKMILTVTLAMFCMVGSANATIFTDVVNLGGLGFGNDLIEWTHSAPADFEVPWDVIDFATITISYKWIDTRKGENIWLDGEYIGTLGKSVWKWKSNTFDVAASLVPFANGDFLNMSLQVNESGDGWGRDYKLGKSKFVLGYQNETAPVPEPSTILLFGAGLAGLLGYSRKRANKKA